MPGKVFIKTFGCQMNEYDSAKMVDVLRDVHGMEPAATAEDADLLLLNTCSVREKAQEKVFSLLGRWKQLKAARPGIIPRGCFSSWARAWTSKMTRSWLSAGRVCRAGSWTSRAIYPAPPSL